MNGESSFERELSVGGKLVFTNVGVSMLPLLREGRDIMQIEALSSSPKRYDTVLFRREGIKGRGRYVLHRILKRKGEKYFIAGDYDTRGELVSREQILGVLTAVFREGRVIKTSDFKYKLYVRFWCAPYHLRFFILKLYRGIKYLISAVKYKIFGR
ncbi:MAG: S24/S26 family peptidase [Clostridia bacterium]|nr:S24/S26 family peptidase [Clostridia bacterium]